MSSFYDDDYVDDEDPISLDSSERTLPDMYIEADEKCGVCGVQNSLERPMRWVCSECGVPTHTACGMDCEPSGGWDRDYDVNYWVCNNCLKKAQQAEAVVVQSEVGLGAL